MTLCDLAQVKVDQEKQAVDSISFARVLIDDYKGSPRHWLYTAMESPNFMNKALGREHAIRKGSLKLISLQKKIGDVYLRRLYDLSTDLKEKRNLLAKPRYRDVIAEMGKRLDAYGGPDTKPNGPFCNLEHCGSAQMIADEKKKTNKAPNPSTSCQTISFDTTTENTLTTGSATTPTLAVQPTPPIPGIEHLVIGAPIGLRNYNHNLRIHREVRRA